MINISIDIESWIPALALDDKVRLCSARGHPTEYVYLGL